MAATLTQILRVLKEIRDKASPTLVASIRQKALAFSDSAIVAAINTTATTLSSILTKQSGILDQLDGTESAGVLAQLIGIFGNTNTVESLLANINSTNQATNTKIDTLDAVVDLIKTNSDTVASDTTSLDGKDFATQSTLSSLNGKFAALGIMGIPILATAASLVLIVADLNEGGRNVAEIADTMDGRLTTIDGNIGDIETVLNAMNSKQLNLASIAAALDGRTDLESMTESATAKVAWTDANHTISVVNKRIRVVRNSANPLALRMKSDSVGRWMRVRSFGIDASVLDTTLSIVITLINEDAIFADTIQPVASLTVASPISMHENQVGSYVYEIYVPALYSLLFTSSANLIAGDTIDFDLSAQRFTNT